MILNAQGNPVLNGKTNGKRFSMSKVIDGSHDAVKNQMAEHWKLKTDELVSPRWRKFVTLFIPPFWYQRFIFAAMRSAYFAGMPTIMKFIQWLMLDWTLTLRRWAYSIGTKTLIEPGNNKITQRIFHRGRLVDEKTWKVW